MAAYRARQLGESVPRVPRPARVGRQQLVTDVEYESLLIEQNGVCSICGGTDERISRSLAVDHDHATNVVRGLLCGRCNLAIGLFADDVTLLRAAIEYLTR